jgi:hypothetical protein
VVAEQMMRDLGIRPDKRKQRIDEIAATIILQDYLDRERISQTAASPAPDDLPTRTHDPQNTNDTQVADNDT